jgi:cytochrome b
MTIASDIRSGLKPEQSQSSLTHQEKVWDVPTRIFHWSIVALIAIGWVSGEEEGIGFVVHSLAGYAVMVALIFRLVWGFVGGAHARFTDFVRSPGAVIEYTKQLLRLKPPHFVGHNPLGGWMILALLAVLTVLVVSGLCAQGDEGVAGPWAASAVWFAPEQWYELHEVSFNVLLALIVLHVLGVVFDQWLTRDKLVRAMFTGVKTVAGEQMARQAQTPRPLRAFVVLALAIVSVGFMVGWQVPSATTDEQAAAHSERGEHERGERD